ncbi:MAG: energy-coupling factor ABC transporter permease [Planctomycetaceae bacterium]|nr:energy-coupling factor ABC transporter permease [Planctomycetaceae bacterium]
MHIPDAVLSPAVCAGTGVLSTAAVGYSVFRLRSSLADRTVPMTGMAAALIFAGQMVNFPLPFLPVSGHLLGGVLAAALVGPWAGCLAVTLVLVVQCFVFADGGVTTLGANILHMAVIGAWGGSAVMNAVRNLLGGDARATIIGSVVASWLSVMAAAALFCLEFALSCWGPLRGSSEAVNFDLARIFTLMVSYHSLIGIGEGLITGMVVSFVLRQEPSLIRPAEPSTHLVGAGRLAFAGCIAAMAVAAFLAPFASEYDDGLEAIGTTQFAERMEQERQGPALLSDYEIPLPIAGWKESPVWAKVSVSLAGILGTAATLGIALALGRLIPRPQIVPQPAE